jgi:MarR family transcriptional regulator, transcriptional regulator for hemolysin
VLTNKLGWVDRRSGKMADIREVWQHANNIIRSARLLINEDLKPLGLSSAEGNILLHLLTKDQGLPQEEIVEQLDISKPAVSRALKSLEVKGFIIREKHPSDMRASLVRMTEKALEIGPEVVRVYNRVYSIGAQGVSKAEIEQFINLFARVSNNFTEARGKRKMRK